MHSLGYAAFVMLLSAAAQAPGAEAKVAHARERFEAIKARQGSLTKVETTFDGWRSTEGNQLLVTFDGAAVPVVTGTLFGEMGKTEVEYYYDEGKLYFALVRRGTYNHPMYLSNDVAGPLKTTWSEQRYYYDGDDLVRHLDGRKQTSLKADEVKAVLDDAQKVHAFALTVARK
jgi:hypothetical protein